VMPTRALELIAQGGDTPPYMWRVGRTIEIGFLHRHLAIF
jgi:hypothetical protein